jgi:predicted metalloprotease with PDZ domain
MEVKMKISVKINENDLDSTVILNDKEFPVSRLLLDPYTDLNESLKAQLELDYEFGVLFVLALKQQSEYEHKLDNITKKLYKKHKELLAEREGGEPKENRIKAEVVEDPEYLQALEEKLEADTIANFFQKVIAKLLEDRRIVLNRLASANVKTF